MTDNSLEAVRLDTLDALRKAAREPGDAFRTPVLATTDSDGLPQGRIIVVRDFDPATMTLTFFTDSRSPKVTSLRQHPAVQLIFYDPGRQIQMRASGQAQLQVRSAEAMALWNQLPEYGRADYLTQRPPGAEIGDPSEGWQFDHEFDAEHFCVIRVRVNAIDWLKLSSSGHRRVKLIWQGGNCQGRWLTP